jgi:riboflavin synthase
VFTGIVQDVGRVESLQSRGGDRHLVIRATKLDLSRAQVGDSICVQGCCVTATAISADTFSADLSRETLSVTTLGDLAPGSAVNLEPALRAGDPLGGHLMSGHVDGVARLTALSEDARSRRLTVEVPEALARYLALKGSVALDGVSLTVNAVTGNSFGVNLIPHTLAVTTLGELAVGARLNLEVDQLARYLNRLLEPYRNTP